MIEEWGGCHHEWRYSGVVSIANNKKKYHFDAFYCVFCLEHRYRRIKADELWMTSVRSAPVEDEYQLLKETEAR